MSKNILDTLPSELHAGASRIKTIYYLDIGRVYIDWERKKYVWFIRYRNFDIPDQYCIVHDEKIDVAILKMLEWLKNPEEHLKDFNVRK